MTIPTKESNPTPSSNSSSGVINATPYPTTTTSTVPTAPSHVESATYPLPKSLSKCLQASVAFNNKKNKNNSATTNTGSTTAIVVQLESIHNALSALIGNCIEALDGLYFSQMVPASVRKHPAFQHRLCIRVATDTIHQTLTITDLGTGMTRSDLINCLGIGRNLTTATTIASKPYIDPTNVTTTSESEATNTTDDDDDDDEDEDDDEDDDEEEEEDDDNDNDKQDVTGDATLYDGDNTISTTAVGMDDDCNDDEGNYKTKEVDRNYVEPLIQNPGLLPVIDNTTTSPSKSKPHDVAADAADTAAGLSTPKTKNVNKSLQTTKKTGTTDTVTLSCTTRTLGGFYAAFCTLGTSVIVGTKSKFDDYYEFHVGKQQQNDHDTGGIDNSIDRMNDMTDDGRSQPSTRSTPISSFNTFEVKRPYPEGTELSVANGFSRFEQVRGDSGTSVTIQLNQVAIDAGLLKEQEVLKPMLLKIVEQTQYTVAFSSDTEQAQLIIDASIKEIESGLYNILQDDIDVDEDTNQMDTSSIEDTDMEDNNSSSSYRQNGPAISNQNVNQTVKERAKYIPIRLSLGERKMLRLVEATMNCCDYTTSVDKDYGSGKNSTARRTHEQLRGVSAVLHGLVTACDYSAGQKLHDENNYIEYASFYRQMFEIARRHKIMNPEKMRTEYGKLIYLLQDAISPRIQQQLGFIIQDPILTVYRFLEKRNGLDLLNDPLIERATEEILAGPGRTRAKIDHDIRLKERAVQHLKKRYKSSTLSSEDIHLCLYSICDNNSFLNSNRVPIDKVIEYLTTNFAPNSMEEGYSLSIVSGTDGARLSHSHERQYYFALQSLTLWRTIINDMFRLWSTAEQDLLNSDSVLYSLQNTGQGMQRVQQCPRTYKAMQQILIRVQNQVKNWVGSSVIHMGDHNVPNALSFIDKYTQVPRILGPIVTCLEVLEQLCEKDEGIARMVRSDFGGFDKLRKDILYDFFRSAFDGSGADNFYDAGSCIDGRLTSAWNWCTQLPEKPFYPIFKLTGFIGFDGEFQ